MPGRCQLFEPGNVGLLEHAADAEIMDHAAAPADEFAGFGRVALGVGVEISLLVVPLHHAALGIVAAHLEVERERDPRLPLARSRRPACPQGGSPHRRGDGAAQKRAAAARTWRDGRHRTAPRLPGRTMAARSYRIAAPACHDLNGHAFTRRPGFQRFARRLGRPRARGPCRCDWGRSGRRRWPRRSIRSANRRGGCCPSRR